MTETTSTTLPEKSLGNTTIGFSREGSIHNRIEQQCIRNPDNQTVFVADQSMNFDQSETGSNTNAHIQRYLGNQLQANTDPLAAQKLLNNGLISVNNDLGRNNTSLCTGTIATVRNGKFVAASNGRTECYKISMDRGVTRFEPISPEENGGEGRPRVYREPISDRNIPIIATPNLTRVLRNDEIIRIIRTSSDPQAAAKNLVGEATAFLRRESGGAPQEEISVAVFCEGEWPYKSPIDTTKQTSVLNPRSAFEYIRHLGKWAERVRHILPLLLSREPIPMSPGRSDIIVKRSDGTVDKGWTYAPTDDGATLIRVTKLVGQEILVRKLTRLQFLLLNEPDKDDSDANQNL